MLPKSISFIDSNSKRSENSIYENWQQCQFRDAAT